jgi:hypothetical protein
LGVARLPAEKAESSRLLTAGWEIAERIADGKELKEIAKQLYPGTTRKDRHNRKDFQRRILDLAAHNTEFQHAFATQGRAELILMLPRIARRLAQRAAHLGKAPDVKLVFEASGFHNPKVNHEHSGDVNIRLVIPRPELPSSDQDVVEAEVVEDE